MAAPSPTSAAARSLWAGLGRFLRPAPNTGARRRGSSRAAAGPPVTGAPHLVPDAAGGTRCVACHLCVAACPSNCIAVITGLNPGGHTPGQRTVREFSIDLARCAYCGLCVEACPERALAMSPDRLGPGGLPLARYPRTAQRFDLEALIRTD